MIFGRQCQTLLTAYGESMMAGHRGYGVTRNGSRIPRGRPIPAYAGLTSEMKNIMFAISNGADVWGSGEARCLREIERRFPGLLIITKPMGAPADGAKQQPYFGAILTAAGCKAIGL